MPEERVLTLSLRRDLMKMPSWKRKHTAVRVLKKVLYKHTRTNKIKIDRKLNEEVCKGKKKLKIKLLKTEEGFKAELA